MILTGDVAFARGQIQSWNVMSPIAVLELDGSSACGKSQQLMSQTNTKDRNLGGLHQFTQMIDSVLTVSWISRPVGDEDTIKVMSHLVNRIVERETSNACASIDQTTKDVLFHTTVDNSNVSCG